ncbi:MAG: hypothetical protein FWC97_00500 [Treponema sp.]|nr:hypothetical protein [Treponema sp.]
MNSSESLELQGIKIAVEHMTLEILKQRQGAEEKSRFEGLPEWVTLEQAAAIKGGPLLTTYRQRSFLRPCCGRNYQMVGGRRCWHRDDVIPWLAITDRELRDYADKYDVKLPDNYAERGAD